jgi:hypothetical protein
MNKLSADNELSLDELITMKLDESEQKHLESQLAEIQSCKKPSRKKTHKKKKRVPESSDSSDDYKQWNDRVPKTWSVFKTMPSHIRDAVVLFLLFVVFSSRLATGQADRVFKIQADQYSVYDLMARGIAVALLFIIFCRLFPSPVKKMKI